MFSRRQDGHAIHHHPIRTVYGLEPTVKGSDQPAAALVIDRDRPGTREGRHTWRGNRFGCARHQVQARLGQIEPHQGNLRKRMGGVRIHIAQGHDWRA
jgi:hypothetical protein